jgi:hypothetical protein
VNAGRRHRIAGSFASLLLASSLLWACADPPSPAGAGASASLSPSGRTPPSPGGPLALSAVPSPPAAPVLTGAGALLDPNPLRLPPRRVTIEPGKRVFTFSDQMLQSAKIGSTLVLYAATVAGFEGDDLIIEGRGGPSYKVHAGYVIPVADDPRVKPRDVVLTEWNSVMRHAVITKLVKDKIGVRFTDMDSKMNEVLLQGGRAPAAPGAPKAPRSARFVKQTDGLKEGNYAALQQAGEFRHVLLVSPVAGEKKRWFCLGFGGAAMLVDEADLRPIPVRYTPKVGAAVWAEWTGTMRKATVQSIDEFGLFTVKYERAGRPRAIGFGLIMPPLEG